MDFGHEHVEDLAAELRQPPLCLRWETRGTWQALKTILPCTEAEAAIAVDIVLNWLRGHPETSYSRDRSHYGEDRPSVLYTYRNVVPTIDGMDLKGWILHDRRRPTPRGCGRQSAVEPKAILIDAVQRAIAVHGRPLPIKPLRPILLRDADGELLPLPKTRKFERMAEEVDSVNRFMLRNGAQVCFQRIFNQTTERGGRWYAVGGAHQVESAEDRLRILINGEASAEVDVRAMHPSMLYAERGLRLDGDAYDIGDWPRDLAKVGMLVLVNARDVEQAVFSISRKEAMREYTTPGTEDAVWAARRLVKEIRRRHDAIADAFCSDAGARLMRRDSDITAAVMKRMTKAGEICLPVHDSYIVRRSASELLESVVREVTHAVGLPDIELTVKMAKEGVGGDGKPVNYGRNPGNVLTYPSILLPSSPSPVCQVQAQDSDAEMRPSAARELESKADGRTSLPESPISNPYTAAEDPTFDSALDPSEDATPVESPAGSLDVASCAPSSVHATSHSLPWYRSSILVSLDLRRHDRAVAAAQAVAGPAAPSDLDWSANLGFGLAQNTDRGSCWTWSLPDRRECVVHLVNAAAETVLVVADQAAAGRVVETYLRSLSGPGPRLRIQVSYAGRYDLGLTAEENAFRFEPVSDVLRRPSLVPGAPDADDEEDPPFVTDPVCNEEDEWLPLAA